MTLIGRQNASRAQAALDPYGAATHEVFNQPVELVDTNLYRSDPALKEAVRREGAEWAINALGAFGARAGSAEYLELGALANKNPPELDTHDRYGRRVDLVRYHPAYHSLMQVAIEEGIHSSPWTEPRKARMSRERPAPISRPRSRPAMAARSP